MGNPNKHTVAYRKAIVEKFGVTEEEVKLAVVNAEDDAGGWATGAHTIIYMEFDIGLVYYSPRFLDDCCDLANKARLGYIECINPAVAAVYD